MRGHISGLEFQPNSGFEYGSVTLTGQNLLDVVEVAIGDVPAPVFTVVTPSRISALVPAGARTGPISIKTNSDLLTSAEQFVVIPGSSPTSDFDQRDLLTQSEVPESRWYVRARGGWGPRPREYRPVDPPASCDPIAWKRARVTAVAMRYIGLEYRPHHIPRWNPDPALVGEEEAGMGLDCSNFTAWVYNYALGISFVSKVEKQAKGPRAPGRKLDRDEPLAPGDLLFIRNLKQTRLSHVAINIDGTHIIDSHRGHDYYGVHIREFQGWHSKCFAWARRVIE